ncbi:MAG: 3-isopropylmalate dehydrogenase [Nitrospirales bacterium]|nr:3-isopropylmalate dehydrogenase [Nitrospira sp.]MCA9480996.1 3-isopropylmalate dehydrogenase [Nitrospira sp.]MDR4487501.1 3-isopropylmalate dehydrogenase [Nitrospirales bacterium]
MNKRITVLSGDGIGREIMPQAIRVLEAIGGMFGHQFAFQQAQVGGEAIDATGYPLPAETLSMAKSADAVLLGAVGGPKWEGLEYERRPERALLGLREQLGLFANLRPAKMYAPLIGASTLKPEVVDGIDVLVVRELTGGIYFGKPKGIEATATGHRGFNTEVYTTEEIRRIAEVAFQAARKRRKLVTSIDKANVLESSELWRREVIAVHAQYPDVELRHMYVDNCAMQLVRNPKQFDVIVTTNLFGDILSDEAAMLTGSIGMLPSASVGSTVGMFEPIHGSAPDIAGKNLANPIGTIASAAMMLAYSFDLTKEAALIEEAIQKTLEQGFRTKDIESPGTTLVGTKEMGDHILKNLSGQ